MPAGKNILEFVITKTCYRDIYMRYPADLFYLPGNTDVYTVAVRGCYLNQKLIDQGLADKYYRWQVRFVEFVSGL